MPIKKVLGVCYMNKLKNAFAIFVLLIAGCVFFSNTYAAYSKECLALKNKIGKIFPAKLTFIPNPNSSNTASSNTAACVLKAGGGGEVFEKNGGNFSSWNKLLNNTLQKNGWHSGTHTQKYAASGVYATVFALEKNHKLIIVDFRATGDLMHCPKDQPIDIYSNCNLTASDREYKLKITLAN